MASGTSSSRCSWPATAYSKSTCRRLIAIAKVAARLNQPAAVLPGDAGDHRLRLRFRDAAHDRHARLDDPGLFAGDRGERVAELLRVVEADAGDDRHDGQADVGRIEPAAESDFQHGRVDLPLDEVHAARSRSWLRSTSGRPADRLRRRPRRPSPRRSAAIDRRARRIRLRVQGWPSTANRSSIRSRWGELNTPVR